MHALGHDAGLAARLALPGAPFNMSGNPAICLPAGTRREEPRSGFSLSAVNSPNGCSSKPATHSSRPLRSIADAQAWPGLVIAAAESNNRELARRRAERCKHAVAIACGAVVDDAVLPGRGIAGNIPANADMRSGPPLALPAKARGPVAVVSNPHPAGTFPADHFEVGAPRRRSLLGSALTKTASTA